MKESFQFDVKWLVLVILILLALLIWALLMPYSDA